MSTIPFAASKRITAHDLATSAGFAGSKRVTAHYVQSAISIHNYFELIRLESNSVLYDFLGESGPGNPATHGDIDYELSAGPIPEHNPYRPRIPEQFIDIGDDFYDFYEENQQIHREQHNITQMGDTTFPYQLGIQTHDIKQFKLGAVGRFYHEDFGIIQARYVQFDKMTGVSFAQSPVGLFRNNDLLEWRVTNDLDLSHPDLVVGISMPYSVPVNESYGWVIVNGPTLQQVKNDSSDAAVGESFGWHETGSVSNAAEGKVLGRRVSRVLEATALLPGQLWVRTESFSEKQIRNLIDDQTTALLEAIEALQAALGSVPSAGQLSNLTSQVALLTSRLNSEIAQRKAMDLAIQQQLSGLDFVTAAQLNNAITNVQNQLAAAVAALQAQIDAIRLIALEALATANQPPNLSAIQSQISTILNLLGELDSRAKGRFPVVDGSIPPNLVYMDDGSLVYLETF
jgi:hypothetical protein